VTVAVVERGDRPPGQKYVDVAGRCMAVSEGSTVDCKERTALTHRETVAGEASVKSSVSNISLTYSDRYSLSPFNKFRY